MRSVLRPSVLQWVAEHLCPLANIRNPVCSQREFAVTPVRGLGLAQDTLAAAMRKS